MTDAEMTLARAHALHALIVRVRQFSTLTERERFSPTRWPATYAADFVRTHSAVVPDEIWEKLDSLPDSRAHALRAIDIWAKQLGLPVYAVRCVLAREYLKRHSVSVPADMTKRVNSNEPLDDHEVIGQTTREDAT